MKKITASAIGMLFATPIWATCQLSGYQANYTFYNKNNKAIGTHSEFLKLKSSNQYEIYGNSHMKVLWIKENMSTTVKGQYNNNQFTPKTYHFHESHKNTTIQFTVSSGRYDPLSYILNLRAALLTNKKSFSYPVQYTATNTSKAKKVNLNALKTVKLNTALGTLEAVNISQTNQNGVTTRYTLAKKYGYLPVEIRGTKAGKMVFAERISGYTPTNSAYCAVKD